MGADQTGFPKLEVQSPASKDAIHKDRIELKWLTSPLRRAARLLSTTICYSFCMAQDWSHGNLFSSVAA